MDIRHLFSGSEEWKRRVDAEGNEFSVTPDGEAISVTLPNGWIEHLFTFEGARKAAEKAGKTIPTAEKILETLEAGNKPTAFPGRWNPEKEVLEMVDEGVHYWGFAEAGSGLVPYVGTNGSAITGIERTRPDYYFSVLVLD